MNKPIQLIALDLDGTLFNNQGIITETNKKVIRAAVDAGIHVVISTGRPFCGLPFEQLKDTGVAYALTANGSGIYHIPDETCLFEDCMDEELILPILDFLCTQDIHMDAFIHGKAYSTHEGKRIAKQLLIPESLRRYILETRTRVDDLRTFIHEKQLLVQKMTLNFLPLADGTKKNRNEVQAFLSAHPQVVCVCGGYGNLEFTKIGVTKGTGLQKLCELLNVTIEQSMAIGDTENDLSILEAAGISVAMGNATPELKEYADYITDSNEEDGVAKAILHFCEL